MTGIAILFEKLFQPVLGSTGLCKDHDLFGGTHFLHGAEADFQSLQESLGLGVDVKTSGPGDVAGQLVDFGIQFFQIDLWGLRFRLLLGGRHFAVQSLVLLVFNNLIKKVVVEVFRGNQKVQSLRTPFDIVFQFQQTVAHDLKRPGDGIG